MNATYLKDTYWAMLALCAGIVILFAGAAFSFNPWPGGAMYATLSHPSPTSFFIYFRDSATMFAIFFWATRPSVRAQWAVLLAWPILTLALYLNVQFDASVQDRVYQLCAV